MSDEDSLSDNESITDIHTDVVKNKKRKFHRLPKK